MILAYHVTPTLTRERYEEVVKRLEAAGVIVSEPYQERPARYTYALTDKGRALGDVLLAYVRWGKKYIPGTRALVKP